MSTVEEILLLKGPEVLTAGPTTTIRQAAHMMASNNVGCLIVVQGNNIQGIFTERDLLKRVVAAGLDLDKTRVDAIMSSPVITCSPTDDVRKCVGMLVGRNFRHLVVMDDDQLVGVISFRDLLALELAGV